MGREKPNTKYKKILTYLGRVFAIIMSILLVIFCKMLDSIDDENFNFTNELIKNLKTPMLWATLISMSLCWEIVYFTVYTFYRDKKLNSQESREIFAEYKAVYKIKPTNLSDYLKYVENPKRKKVAYIEMMESKLEFVQNKLEKIPMEKYGSKLHKKLVNKEKTIIEHLNENYINEHIFKLSVKYNRVRVSDFMLDRNTNAIITDKTKSNESNKITNMAILKLFSSIFFSFIVVSFAFTLNAEFKFKSNGFWITIIVVLLNCLIQAYFGASFSNKVTDSEIIAPTIIKTDIIKASLQWENSKRQDNEFSKAFYKLVDDLKEKEDLKEKKKVVISQAELEYLSKHKEEIQEKIIEENEKEEDVA